MAMFTAGSRGSGFHLPPHQPFAPSSPWRRNIINFPCAAAAAGAAFRRRIISSSSSSSSSSSAATGGVGLSQKVEEEEEEQQQQQQQQEVEKAEDNSNTKSRQIRRSADWKAARAYRDSGVVYEGRIESFNNGGLLIRFYSLLGFLPYPLLSPRHSQEEPQKSIQNIAKGLVGSSISLKVVQASEEDRKLIFSEKDAIWSKYSAQIKVGDVFYGRVGSVEDYGAFIDLCFPDGYYHLTGLVHVSEVSWDLVQDMRDVLSHGDEVKVKVIQIDREKARITLSIKQLEDDPLLERLDKVIPQEGQSDSGFQGLSNHLIVEPLPGLESICKELLQEDGISDIRIGRQGLEKRVVSQDLELWLSNVPAKDKQFTLLARAGRQVQEVHLTTTLDQDGIKRAVQRVLGRVP